MIHIFSESLACHHHGNDWLIRWHLGLSLALSQVKRFAMWTSEQMIGHPKVRYKSTWTLLVGQTLDTCPTGRSPLLSSEVVILRGQGFIFKVLPKYSIPTLGSQLDQSINSFSDGTDESTASQMGWLLRRWQEHYLVMLLSNLVTNLVTNLN